MARLPRLVVPGQVHHIIQRGNNRQPVFVDDEDRRAYLAILGEAGVATGVLLHAYVLMDDHVHLLATPRTTEGLSQLMQALGRRYVSGFNRRHQRTGTLWEGRFRGSVIESDLYFLTCMRCIELRPVHAGLVAQPADFFWSSHAHHVGLRMDPLLTDHELFWSLGNTPFDRQLAYKRLIEQPISQTEVERIVDAAVKGWGLGTPSFLKQMSERAGRPAAPRRRGRPRKLHKS